MLEKSLNRSKKNQPLEDWVKEKCGDNREKFLEEHLIPDVDLSIDNFTEFYEKRKQLLISKLKKVLGMKQDDETGDNKQSALCVRIPIKFIKTKGIIDKKYQPKSLAEIKELGLNNTRS